ncbi:cytochrome c oxidase assembly factor 5 [Planococcus citri]|uniref:cytochrome c oxidase assembly factor 5 n=1 Tax=Planococcus citri TaxID=170843 RepID=UPI0031F91BA7
MADPIEAEKIANKKPKKLCSGLRRDLKICVLESDCVKIDRVLPKKCLQDFKVPQECLALAYEFFECKRQFVDMRKRFRGNRGY